MNRVSKFVIFGAIASLAIAPSAFAQKIAFINSQKIMPEAPGRAEAEATYDKEMGRAKAKMQVMQDSMRKLMEQFDKEAPKLDSAAREARGQDLRDQQEDFQKTAEELEARLQKTQADLARPLMEQVSKVLDELREKGGYAMIFDVGSGSSVVVSADKTLDITEQVIARLKELGPPKAATGPTPSRSGVSR